MSVEIMSDADTRFIADNMLTADDFDLSESLDISALARISQELQLYRQSLPGLEGDHTFKALGNFFVQDEILWDSAADTLGLDYKEITCDINCNLQCDDEIKVEMMSPNPSPGSTSGYSSQGSWNEELSVTEIEVPDNEFSESPPDSPPVPTAQNNSVASSTRCIAPVTCPAQPIVLNPVHITSVHKTKVASQKLKAGVREIQPKAIKRKLQLCHPHGQGRPLILTAEEFSQMTATPFTLQQQQPPIFISPPLAQQTRLTDSNRKSSIPYNLKADAQQPQNDVKALKRQQRMIRNRESAFLSRKKRREYVQNLEQHLSDLNQEKARVLAENCQLKERIKTLENENKKLKMIFPSSSYKKTTCLMAVLFMLAVNLTPFSSLFNGAGLVQKTPVASVNRYGRSLLWTSELKESENLPISLDEDLPQKLHAFKAPSLKNLSSSCPTYVNKTEALRLEKELRGWAMRVEKQKQKEKPTVQRIHKKLPMPKMHALFQARSHQPSINVGHKDLEVYSAPRSLYEDLFDALERRDDTFYFVSFSGDHLLLPASAHNRTQRPKMSLVMPAMTLNETAKENQVMMMQIDCEVMNMHFVEVKETAIPAHLRHKLAHAAAPASHNTSQNMEKKFKPLFDT